MDGATLGGHSLAGERPHARWLAADWAARALILAAACLSMALTGFQFNVWNNAYHIPIVLGWADDPAFRDDLIVPTLHLFASPIYVLLRPFATEANIAPLFAALMLAGRVATFWAFDLIGRSLGLRTLAQRAAFQAVLVTGIGLYTTSAIGADGLFIPYFTHSELAQGFALLSVAALIRGRLTLAAGLAGLTFAINAFIGVWLLFPLGLACLLTTRDLKAVARRTLGAAAAFSLPALPVVVWIMSAQAGRAAPAGFDYAAFLRDFFPLHFFIGSASRAEIVQVLAQAAAAALAITTLPRRAMTAYALGGLVLACLAGVAVGELSSNRWLLNLHLMRSAGMVALVATPIVAAAALRALADRRIGSAVPATLVLLALLADRWPLALVSILLLVAAKRQLLGGRASPLGRATIWAPVAGAALVAGMSISLSTSQCCYGRDAPWDGRSVPDNRALGGAEPSAPHWREVQRWARLHSARDSMFLQPPELDGFRTGARRPVWVTSKDGGAVPWDPALYPVWSTRMREVTALRTVDEMRAYACARGIDHVIADGRTPIPGFDSPDARYRNRYFAVFASCSR